MRRRDFMTTAAGAALVAATTTIPVHAQSKETTKVDKLKPSSKTISVEHMTIPSGKSFEVVRAALEKAVPRLDDGIFVLLRYGEGQRALAELEKGPPISIFSFRDHGALLNVIGAPRKAIQYDIGNPLTASRMTRHDLSAGLYAPVRVFLQETSDGTVTFEYDRPISTFGQFGNAEVDKVAKELDEALFSALSAAAAA